MAKGLAATRLTAETMHAMALRGVPMCLGKAELGVPASIHRAVRGYEEARWLGGTKLGSVIATPRKAR